jgi:hypothetical protein
MCTTENSQQSIQPSMEGLFYCKMKSIRLKTPTENCLQTRGFLPNRPKILTILFFFDEDCITHDRLCDS